MLDDSDCGEGALDQKNGQVFHQFGHLFQRAQHEVPRLLKLYADVLAVQGQDLARTVILYIRPLSDISHDEIQGPAG